jgi:gas vesicle protein
MSMHPEDLYATMVRIHKTVERERRKEMEHSHDEGFSAGSVILAFLLGGLVGVGVSLLMAPKSGRETREKLQDFTSDAKETAEDYIDQVKMKVTSTVGRGKDFFQEKKSIITTAVDAGKDAYEREKERLTKE